MERLQKSHPPVAPSRVGVLLINLGTPEGTDYRSVRRYLSEFLSDRRVVELHPALWQPVLQGPVLAFRPRRSGRLYRKIWNRELDESPLRTATRAQAEALASRFSGDGVVVDWAMRYGRPSIRERIGDLAARGCRRILFVSMYPQYAAATTATAYDEAFRALQGLRWQPAARTAPPWHDEPAYIEAVAGSIREHLEGLASEPEVLLLSFHGLPRACLDKGDPYYCFCSKTARLVREALGRGEAQAPLVFQSRFGPARWLGPCIGETAVRLAREGVRRLAVATPGFSADCLETLEEIGIGLREAFLAAGGAEFSRVPCLNDQPRAVDLYESLIRRELGGWI